MKEQDGAVEDSNKESIMTQNHHKIEKITKADKVVEFLILVSG